MDFRIGQLAEKCNLNKATIRYYERLGLIPEPPRTNSGYRIYSSDVLERLLFIKRMKELGFTLREIGQFLAVDDGNMARCGDIPRFTEEKIAEIRLKIQDLHRIENLLLELKAKCDCSSDTNFCECPVIQTLIGEEPI